MSSNESGLVMFGTIIVALGLVIASAQVSAGLAITVGVVAILAVVALGVVQSALSAVYSAALSRYATVGEAPPGFEGTSMQSAFAPR